MGKAFPIATYLLSRKHNTDRLDHEWKCLSCQMLRSSQATIRCARWNGLNQSIRPCFLRVHLSFVSPTSLEAHTRTLNVCVCGFILFFPLPRRENTRWKSGNLQWGSRGKGSERLQTNDGQWVWSVPSFLREVEEVSIILCLRCTDILSTIGPPFSRDKKQSLPGNAKWLGKHDS